MRWTESSTIVRFPGGIAVFCQDGSSYTELLTSASGALEASKHKGKNKCTLYDEELIHTRLRSLEIMDRLRSSVMNHMEGFSVVYQPIVRSSDTKIAEAEALLRWSCKDMGSVSPLEFTLCWNPAASLSQWGSGCWSSLSANAANGLPVYRTL